MMIEIVPKNTGNVLQHFAEEIKSVSREIMKTEEVHDLFSDREIDISITDSEKELLNYDCLILSTEILVSKKYSKIFQLVLISDLDDTADELTFAIVYGAEDLDPKDIFADARSVYGFDLVKDAYREALLTTLRELAK